MESIHIPQTDLYPTRIGLGTSPIRGHVWGGNEQNAIKTIISALNKGINLIDTAPVYGFGKSEEIVGAAIAQYGQRDKIIISTKVGLHWQGGAVVRNATAQAIQQGVTDSLTRLKMDYIDIYHVHWPDPLTPIEETALAMDELLCSGKIRAVGVSNFSKEQMENFAKYCPIHVSQQIYNLFDRDIEESVLPYAEHNKIISFAYGSLCRGLLSGKNYALSAFDEDDRRRHYPKFQAPYIQQYLNAVTELNQYAQQHYGKNIVALAIRWILDSGNTVALWGAHRSDYVQHFEDVMGWYLDKQAIRAINSIISKHVIQPVELGLIPPALR